MKRGTCELVLEKEGVGEADRLWAIRQPQGDARGDIMKVAVMVLAFLMLFTFPGTKGSAWAVAAVTAIYFSAFVALVYLAVM